MGVAGHGLGCSLASLSPRRSIHITIFLEPDGTMVESGHVCPETEEKGKKKKKKTCECHVVPIRRDSGMETL